MKAVGYHRSLPIVEAESLLDLDLPEPHVSGHDLLVKVQAVSVNPVDTKQRRRAEPSPGQANVLGYDAAGVVVATGPDVTLFKNGDEVYYAGSIIRSGTNAELHLVDERIVGRKPRSLDFANAAALPLTSITAWELLFDRLGITPGKHLSQQTLLIIGAGGGVGSILTQLAVRLTPLTVIGTASRPDTADWITELGAHHVIDHRKPISEELRRIGIPQVSHVASLTNTDSHLAEIIESLEPQGKLGLIDDPPPIDINLFKKKCLSVHWELMFTRSLFNTPDIICQHRLLNEVASLIDSKVLRTTVGEHFGSINSTNLKRAHALIESGKARGKIVLESFN